MARTVVRTVRRLPTLPLTVTLALALAACGGSGPAGLSDVASLARGAEGKATGPSGLEQRVVTGVEAPPAGSPYSAILVATSTLKNTGATPTRVTARVCLVKESDFESTATLDRFEPLVSCAAESMTKDLAPGETVGPIEVQFGVRSGPGQYTLKLRHSLDPAFKAEAGFRIQ